MFKNEAEGDVRYNVSRIDDKNNLGTLSMESSDCLADIQPDAGQTFFLLELYTSWGGNVLVRMICCPARKLANAIFNSDIILKKRENKRGGLAQCGLILWHTKKIVQKQAYNI